MTKSLLGLLFAVLCYAGLQTPQSTKRYSFGNVPEHRDHMDYYAWAAEYSMQKEWAAMQLGVPMIVRPQEAPVHVKSCQNDGKKGSKENPRDCQCWNPCADEYGIPPDDPARVHGDRRCSTYCRKADCKCKKPCL